MRVKNKEIVFTSIKQLMNQITIIISESNRNQSTKKKTRMPIISQKGESNV